MQRYYFDARGGDELTVDDVGVELPDAQAVQQEAAMALAEMACDEVRKVVDISKNYRMAIEVRDDDGPLLTAKFTFEIEKAK